MPDAAQAGLVKATIVVHVEVAPRTAEEQLLAARQRLEANGFEIVAASTGIDHGTLKGYRRGCKCDLCMEANALHCLAWRVRRRLEAV